MDHKSETTDTESTANDNANSAVASEKNPKFKWYVVHTYSGFEEKAKLALYEQARNMKQEHYFGEVIIPTMMKESVLKSGKKKQISRTQFPGYMLVEMEMTDESMSLVKNTPRITGFIGNQKSPRPLPEKEVLRYVNPDSGEEADSIVQVAEVLFEKGEGVKVIDGPFSNFDGIVDEVRPEKARLRVLVSIFGRETPVDLEYGQVEKLN